MNPKNNKIHFILLFFFALTIISIFKDANAHEDYFNIPYFKANNNFEKYILNKNNIIETSTAHNTVYNPFKKLTNFYFDDKINLKIGNVNIYQKVPKNLQESLKMIRREIHIPLGISFEKETKLGKIKTEIEKNKNNLNSIKISNQIGCISVYCNLNEKEKFSSKSTITTGLILNFDF